MFEGNPTMMLKVLSINKSDISVEDLQDWDSDYKEAVYQTIQEEDSRGVRLRDKEDVPSIKSIKEKVLRRVDALIAATEDPARLAQVYKILSEFEVSDDKKEKSVLDAINEAVKPLTPTKKKEVTMLEKMRQENRITEPGKRGREKQKKVQPVAVVPEETSEWKPEIAPHAIVTKSAGNIVPVVNTPVPLRVASPNAGTEKFPLPVTTAPITAITPAAIMK